MASGDIVFENDHVFFTTKTDTNGAWNATGSNNENSTYDHVVELFLSIQQNVTTGDCPLSVDNVGYTVRIIQN